MNLRKNKAHLNETTKLQIKTFIEDARRVGKVLTPHSISTFVEEMTGEQVEITPNEVEIYGMVISKSEIFQRPPMSRNRQYEEQSMLSKTSKYPNEFIFVIDEFGYQLNWYFAKKYNVIRKRDEEHLKMIYDRNAKKSNTLFCFNLEKQYLTPFIKTPPIYEMDDEISQHCVVGLKGNRGLKCNWYTKNDFQNWFENVVKKHLKELKSNSRLRNVNALIVMDEYFEPFFEGIEHHGIDLHFIRNNFFSEIIPIRNIIEEYLSDLKKEFEIIHLFTKFSP